MLRLIASDIDGTLLQNGAKVLPTELFDEICRLKRQGILFCPASGRQYHSLRQLFAPVADRIPFICENGAVVFGPGDPGPALVKTVMDRRLAVELCRGIMALPEVEVLISGANTSYLCPKRESFVSEVRDGLGNSAVVVERPEDVPEDIIKVSAYCQLCKALGIGFDEVMAFGDSYNDLPMLQKVGQPYLVTSAAPELQARVAGSCKAVLDILRTL